MVSKVCSRSHGHPPGLRSRAIMAATRASASPVSACATSSSFNFASSTRSSLLSPHGHQRPIEFGKLREEAYPSLGVVAAGAAVCWAVLSAAVRARYAGALRLPLLLLVPVRVGSTDLVPAVSGLSRTQVALRIFPHL